jgi:hypothetical protein
VFEALAVPVGRAKAKNDVEKKRRANGSVIRPLYTEARGSKAQADQGECGNP